MTIILQTAAIAIAVLGAGAVAVTALNRDIPDFAVPAGPWEDGSALDGRAFHMTGTVRETGAGMPESVFSFVNGQFKSSRCQLACDFGWNGYRTFTEGEKIHFTATTRCHDAPFTVVWYGIVTGDEVQFEGTWTTRRWYWTHQINAVGEGTPTPLAGGAASG